MLQNNAHDANKGVVTRCFLTFQGVS